ncbi:hypothetical protein Pla175_00710 [Pirellulimonas nuda]|uniref:Ice-binding protein C-terminal domain-containing protein n=1 Tax=Pirellulimonas nuda TaxID=2528009 RepID=A0A518D5H0_9BACT|nr:dockerin type I domain-containing protein [Pirellulimonas nuda]QDU86721.1 hypothetical protein Pla175_00710 [Pirellulimonas nuda]
MRLILVTAAAVLLCPQVGWGESLFMVGNSLTVDSQPVQLGSIAAAQGISLSVGQHINCNSSLTTILNNPGTTCVIPAYGTFDTALPGYAWDKVSFQSFAGQNSTMANDVASFNQLTSVLRQNPANADSQLYLYQSWPLIQNWDQWEQPVANTLTQATVHQRDYFDHLLGRIQATEPGTLLIPEAEVFFRVREAIAAGEITGVASFTEMYRDQTHASYGLGRFVANTTLASTLFQTDQTGQPSPFDSTFDGVQYSITTRNQLQAIVWDVVKNHPDAGIAQTLTPGDYNGDGSVTAADLQVWKANLGSKSHLSADGNHDGRVDAADYTVWRDAFSQMAAIGGGSGVPEPSSAVLAAAGAALAAFALRARRPRK